MPTRKQPSRQVKNKNDNFTATNNDNDMDEDTDHFTHEDNELLMNRVYAQLDESESLRCNERMKKLDWKQIKFRNKSEAACKAQVEKLLKPIPRSRTLAEIITIYKAAVSENTNTPLDPEQNIMPIIPNEPKRRGRPKKNNPPKNEQRKKPKKEKNYVLRLENGEGTSSQADNNLIDLSSYEIDFNCNKHLSSTSKTGVKVKMEKNIKTSNADEPMENGQSTKTKLIPEIDFNPSTRKNCVNVKTERIMTENLDEPMGNGQVPKKRKSETQEEPVKKLKENIDKGQGTSHAVNMESRTNIFGQNIISQSFRPRKHSHWKFPDNDTKIVI